MSQPNGEIDEIARIKFTSSTYSRSYSSRDRPLTNIGDRHYQDYLSALHPLTDSTRRESRHLNEMPTLSRELSIPSASRRPVIDEAASVAGEAGFIELRGNWLEKGWAKQGNAKLEN